MQQLKTLLQQVQKQYNDRQVIRHSIGLLKRIEQLTEDNN